MPKIDVEGTEYYYEVHGSGHPLVLISGLGGDHASWSTVIEAFSRHFQVLTFDNLGVGQTVDKGKELSIEAMGEGVMKLIQALHLKKPHILGQSMGGAIAQVIAGRYADQIGKLVLVATAAKWRQAALYIAEFQIKMLEKKLPFEDFFEMLVGCLYGETFLRNKQKIEELRIGMMKRGNSQSLEDKKRQFRAIVHFDGRENAKKITSKTLIIFGKEDIAVLPTCSGDLAALIPHAQILGCPCAHAIIREIPEHFSQIVIQFLTDAEAR